MRMAEGISFQIKRVFNADRGLVFAAWTQAELMGRWLAPGDMLVTSVNFEAKLGGRYRIEMGRAEGSAKCQSSAVAGTIKNIVANDLVWFTWGWPSDSTPETLLMVDFHDVSGGTEVSLTQTGFAEQERCDQHRAGWLACFDKLESLISIQDLSGPTGIVEKHFTKLVPLAASCARAFDAVATIEGVRNWWTPLVSGSEGEGGEIVLGFEGLEEHIRLRIDAARPPFFLQWACIEHTGLSDWANTRMTFELRSISPGRTELYFEHVGLTPELECYGHCRLGWDRFLSSLKDYIEHGHGKPFRSVQQQQTMQPMGR
jgi:uncharacterized protein YndB with AHSA1/START domain